MVELVELRPCLYWHWVCVCRVSIHLNDQTWRYSLQCFEVWVFFSRIRMVARIRSIGETGQPSRHISFTSWSEPSRSHTTPTFTRGRSSPWKSTCRKSECRLVRTLRGARFPGLKLYKREKWFSKVQNRLALKILKWKINALFTRHSWYIFIVGLKTAIFHYH